MAFTLFGYKIGKEEPESTTLKSFVPPTDDDAAIAISGSGVYGTYVDLEGKVGNESETIRKYREMASQPECDMAIDDVVNETIVHADDDYPVQIILDKIKQSESFKNKIREEFRHVMKLMDFNNLGYDIFRRWYVDGKLYYHMVIDEKFPKKGLKELRYIDPRKIRKVKELPKNAKTVGVSDRLYNRPVEYFLYSEKGFAKDANNGLKISPDSICYVHSGIHDKTGSNIVSHLHKAIKPLNQLRMLEDATVIYRISRAPERRIFYIDVGNLPKMKAEQYLRDVMQKYKNKLVYDAQTGEVRDDRRYQTMLEDFWLPRREGGRGTEITTLPGGQNLGEIEDVLYFQKKLYKALNVPISRLEADSGFSLGRASEISRDEIKFSKFVGRLRLRFSHLFDKVLETHLLLKGICTKAEWKALKEDIYYDYISDSHFMEMKDSEVLRERVSILNDIDPYVGKYFSKAYVKKHVLRLTEEDMDELDKEIDQEESEGEYDDEEMATTKPTPFQATVTPTPQEESVETDFEEFYLKETDDQVHLAKSMTKFFDSLVEGNGNGQTEK